MIDLLHVLDADIEELNPISTHETFWRFQPDTALKMATYAQNSGFSLDGRGLFWYIRRWTNFSKKSEDITARVTKFEYVDVSSRTTNMMYTEKSFFVNR